MSSPASRKMDSRSRLERAKYQYENLLLHAGSNLLIDEPTVSEAMSSSSSGLDKSQRLQNMQTSHLGSSRLLPDSMFGPSSRIGEAHQDTPENGSFHYPQMPPAIPPIDASMYDSGMFLHCIISPCCAEFLRQSSPPHNIVSNWMANLWHLWMIM